MSTSRLRGASASMPNQANGYSWKYHVRSASGTWKRQWLREPSAPTRKSAWISEFPAAASVNQTFGFPRRSWTVVSLTL